MRDNYYIGMVLASTRYVGYAWLELLRQEGYLKFEAHFIWNDFGAIGLYWKSRVRFVGCELFRADILKKEEWFYRTVPLLLFSLLDLLRRITSEP